MSVHVAAEHALLRQVVIRFVRDGRTVGTGFAVAPDLVVTAAHVWQDADSVQTLDGRMLSVPQAWSWQEKPWKKHLAAWPDLALLQIGERLEHFAPLGSRLLTSGALLRYYGMPTAGGSTALTADNATLVALDGDEGEALRLTQTQVQGGCSGGPLVDPETAQAVGVVVASKDPDQALGGFAVSAEHLMVRWPRQLARPDDTAQRVVWESVYARPSRVAPHRGRLAYRMGEFFFGFYAEISKNNRDAREVAEFLVLSEQLGVYQAVAKLIDTADDRNPDLYEQLRSRIQMAMVYGGQNLMPFFDLGQDMLAIRGGDAKQDAAARDIVLAKVRRHLERIARVAESLPMHLAWDRISVWWRDGRLSSRDVDALLVLVHAYFLLFALPDDSAPLRSAIAKVLSVDAHEVSDEELATVVAAAERVVG